MTETQLVTQICDYLASAGYFFWRSNNVPAGGRQFGVYRALPKYTPKGLPDIMLIRDGRFYGIEVKRPATPGEREPNGRAVRGGTLRPEQAAWGILCAKAGGKFQVVRSVEDVKAFLV